MEYLGIDNPIVIEQPLPNDCEERKKREWWLECVSPKEVDTVDPSEEYETPLKMML